MISFLTRDIRKCAGYAREMTEVREWVVRERTWDARTSLRGIVFVCVRELWGSGRYPDMRASCASYTTTSDDIVIVTRLIAIRGVGVSPSLSRASSSSPDFSLSRY